MDKRILIQFKKVINNNKKVNEYVRLTLADKLRMRKLSKEIRQNQGINKISFEDFVLICKFQKIKAYLRVEDKYVTKFIDILQFDAYTLKDTIYKCIENIYEHGDENNYKNINLDLLRKCMIEYNNKVLLFDNFMDICKQLHIKITIE